MNKLLKMNKFFVVENLAVKAQYGIGGIFGKRGVHNTLVHAHTI